MRCHFPVRALAAAFCLVPLVPAAAHRSDRASRSERRALDVIVRPIVTDALGANPRSGERILLVLPGWGNYSPPDKRAVVGNLDAFAADMDAFRERPDWDPFEDSPYRRQALAKAYPGCTSFVEIQRPVRLPSGELLISYTPNHWDFHIHGDYSYTLHRSQGKWRIVAHHEGEVSY
jgi:hypothetical protein